MPLFRALAKNMAASYFGETALRFCNGSYTSVCLYSVPLLSKLHSKRKDFYSNLLFIKFQRPNEIHGDCFQRYVYRVFTYLYADSYLICCVVIFLNRRPDSIL